MGKDAAAGRRAATGEPAVLGRGLRVVGRVRGEGDLRVEANLEGEISVSGELQLAAGAEVTGSVAADTIVVIGRLEGNATAQRSVAIRSGGRVHGDILAPELSLEEGGALEGRVEAEFELPEELA